MNRPGTAGLLVLGAFAIVFAVEFNTLLGMFGIDIAPSVYFPAIGTILAVVFGGLLLLPKNQDAASVSA
ncbi:hypothetical protein ACFQJ7_04590 [Halovenus rubra]|uniref:Uncharacterized protein n=2 Tax=Halovenus rubra TaxID=869890 RepID=A0ACC7DX37_9EURY|nr:hypothetical protein [Halovenus rubra]